MNKKFKLKRIKLGILLTLFCSIASMLTVKIYANTDQANSDKGASSEQTTCEKKHKTCNKENIKTIYNPKITNSYNETTKQEIITVKIDKTEKAVKFYYIIVDLKLDGSGYTILKEGYLTNQDNSVQIFISTDQEHKIEGIIALEESSECPTGKNFEVYPHESIKNAIDKYLQSPGAKNPKVEKIDDKKCRYALFAKNSIHIEHIEDTKEENLSLLSGGLCHSFRNGLCDNFGKIDGVEDPTALNIKSRCEKYNPKSSAVVPKGYSNLDQYYARVLNYCYSSLVDANFNDKTISTMISNAMLSYVGDTTEDSPVELKPEDPDSKEKDPTSKITLKCDKNKVSTTYANIGDDYEYTNINKYHYTNVKTDTETSSTGKKYTCEKECQEEITVQYGPPVAVKAGLCFEYQVKVESKVTCKSKFYGDKPDPDDYKVCTPVPRCNQDTKFFDQAGPNEEFDACVYDCDGGKYSQSCVNSCYDKVYRSKDKYLGLNYSNQVSPSQINNNMLTTKAYYEKDADIYELMKLVKNNENCGYVRDETTKVISWECKTTPKGWENYGRYYFYALHKAKQTLRDDFNVGPGEPRYGETWWYQAFDGFKKACWNNDCSSYCGQTCTWTGCSSAKYLNPTDSVKDFNADMEAYTAAKQSCTESVSCNTETTTFTIRVDNDGSNIIPEEPFKAIVTNKAWTDDNNIIIDNGQCYKDDSSTKKYMTEWGVPGTSINNKTGEISYEKKASGTGWTYRENQFCTSLQTKNVNEDWYKWRVDKLEGDAPNPTKYNIIATTSDFGYFNWDFEIQCFYAAYDDGCPDPPCDGPEELSYRIRSVDNGNLFPDPDATVTDLLDKSLSGRDPGFNWTYEATDIRNSDYEITPTTLMKEIQTLGTNIYNGDPYLDYEFILDQETLKMVANYKTKFNDFSSGDTKKANNVISYKSRLINEKIASTNKKLPPASSFGCNNKAVSGGCQTFS